MVNGVSPFGHPHPATLLRLSPADDIALHARVRVPNGRIGNVIGFYRGPQETVVVRYDGGESGAYPADDLIVFP